MAIATVLFASCNKHNSSSSEVLYKDSSISGTSYNSAMSYYNSTKVLTYDEVFPSNLTEDNLEESSSLNDYSIHCDGSKDFTITDTNGNYYHVSVDEYGNVTAYDLNGNFYRSSTDDCGYTTGFDSNGNYYLWKHDRL